MNLDAVRFVRRRWYDHIEPAIREFDKQTRGKRGRKPQHSTGVLFLATVVVLVERQTPQVKFLARQLAQASPEVLAEFGIEHPPSAKQMYRMMNAVKRWQQAGLRCGESRLQELFDALVPPSAVEPGTDPDDDGLRMLDTTMFDAYCSKVGITTQKAKEGKASDPDARWLRHGELNVDDGTHRARRKTTTTGKVKSRPKAWLGYAGVNVSRTVNGREVIERCTVLRANEDDAPVGIGLILDDPVSDGVRRVVMDQGFSNLDELNRLRAAGVHSTFDISDTQKGLDGYFHGNPVIDGAVYAPTVKPHLYKLPHPGVNADKEKLRKWREAMIERSRHLLPINGTADTVKGVRVQSAADRGWVKCPDVPGSYAKADAKPDEDPPPECEGGHAPGEGCLMRNATFRADNAPYTYQWPPFGSKQHLATYDKRVSVERLHGRLKGSTGAHFVAGRFAFRGIEKVSVLYALAVVATNLIPEWNELVAERVAQRTRERQEARRRRRLTE